MIGGRDPVIIFHFSKNVPGIFQLNKIPVVSENKTQVETPPIPLYLHREITGLAVDSEDKQVGIETVVDTMTDGSKPKETQKGLTASVSVGLIGNKNAIGLSVLLAMLDLCYDKLTSEEYAITYMHGPTTIFRGRLLDFTANQTANTELMNIQVELSRGQKDPEKAQGVPEVTREQGAIPL